MVPRGRRCYAPQRREGPMRRAVRGRVVALVSALAAGAASVRATVVHIDMSSLFDADVVLNDGSGTLDPTQLPVDSGSAATGNFCFPTASVALRLAVPPETPSGLPDDAFFPASAVHPDVQLG